MAATLPDATWQDLRLEIDGKVRFYAVEKREVTDGTVYDLRRVLEAGEEGYPGILTYAVWFSRSSNKTMCECLDGFYRGHIRPCKHVAALQALRARGMI
jgi:hypothetical protein